MAPFCDFSHPQIMDWTILPARISARAWVDPGFARSLLADPAPIIRAMAPKSCPPGIDFRVHENTERVRHFPLPAFRAALVALPHDELLQGIVDETGGDMDLEWFLPAQVILRAFTDAAYKARLLADAGAVLRADGFDCKGFEVKIHENTAGTRHLVLPVNPWRDERLDYDVLVERLVSRMMTPA